MENNTIELPAVKDPVNAKGEYATFVNQPYGDHFRNTFDIWLAESDHPAPLVIYIHGGGFIGGDKSKYYESKDLVRFLESGVSVATINYRFMTDAPYGIMTSFNDSKRCLQYIRHHASKYNIDKNRIACSGGSAGAGTALWLAFSDEMAEPFSQDPVLRESTRITCAGAFATQSTYDIFQWEKTIGIPMAQTREQFAAIGTAFGIPFQNGTDLFRSEKRRELDFLSKMNKNSAPVFVCNQHKAGIPESQDDLNHHPLHAKVIKEKAEEVGLEAVVYAPGIGIVDPSGKDLVQFFIEKFMKPEF